MLGLDVLTRADLVELRARRTAEQRNDKLPNSDQAEPRQTHHHRLYGHNAPVNKTDSITAGQNKE